MDMKFIFVVLLLAGCASDTGIVPIGNDLYMSSKQDYSFNWHGGKVKADLYQQAAKFCSEKNKKSVPVSDSERDASMYGNYASAEIKFRCE